MPRLTRVQEQRPAAGRVPADRCRPADPTSIQQESKKTIEIQSRAHLGCEVECENCECMKASPVQVAPRPRSQT